MILQVFLAFATLSLIAVGGATAVAAKTGLLKSLWKVIVIGAVAVGAFFYLLIEKPCMAPDWPTRLRGWLGGKASGHD